MKRLFILLFVAVTIVSCNGNANKQDAELSNQSQEVGIVDVNVDSLITNPSQYVDQTVRFVAVVEHVCQHSGQKLTVMGTLPSAKIKVMGSQSVPSFEPTLNGTKIEVVGIVKGMATESVETCESDSTAAKNITYAVECVTVKAL